MWREERRSIEPFFMVKPWAFVRKTKAGSLANSSGQCKGHENIYYYLGISAECSQCCSLSHSRPQQQITGFQSVKPTLTDCKCVRYIDQTPHPQYANTRSLIYSSCRHLSANKLNANLRFIGSRETCWCDRTFGVWQKLTNHKLVRRNV